MLVQKSKCSGCKALVSEKGKYSCKLGLKISYKVVQTVALSPKPTEPCEKPKTLSALN